MHTIIDKIRKLKPLDGKLLLGTFSLTVSTVVVKIISLIYKIPIAGLLGDEGMGYFNSAYTIFALFVMLCTSGIPKTVMLLLSDSDSQSNGEWNCNEVMQTAFSLFLLIGIFFSAGLLVFSAPLARLIGNTKAAISLLCVAPAIVFSAMSGVMRGYLNHNSRLIDMAISQLVEGVAKLAIGICLAMLGIKGGLPLEYISALAIIGVTLGSILSCIYLLICYKKQNKGEKTGQNIKRKGRSRLIKRMMSIAIPLTLSTAVMSFTSLVDLGLIMRGLAEKGFTEQEASALYGNYTTLAVPMLNLALSLASPIAVAYLPMLARSFSSSDIESFDKSERAFSTIVSFISAPIMIGLLIYSEEILSVLFPNSEIVIGGALLRVLAPGIFFASSLLVTNNVFEACGMVRTPLLCMTIGGVAKVFTSYFLIAKTDLGIIGAPIGSVVSYAVSLLVALFIYGVVFDRPSPIFGRNIIPYLAAFIAVTLSRSVHDRLSFSLSPIASLAVAIVISALIYLGLGAFVSLFIGEKKGKIAKYTNLFS